MMRHKRVELDKNLELPLVQMITFRIARLNAKLNAQSNKILKNNGNLSLMQWRVLVFIHTTEKATHSSITEQTGFDGGQISRSIKAMISTGLLTTEMHETDNRRNYLHLTEKGFSMYKAARPAMRERQMSLINALETDESEALFSALKKLEILADSPECTK